jgi:coenzyme PQQ precursor peptide PqqA
MPSPARVVLTAAAPVPYVRCGWTEEEMTWRKPKIAEVPLGAEINMYVCAQLKR